MGKDDIDRYIVAPLIELDSRLREYWMREITGTREEAKADWRNRNKWTGYQSASLFSISFLE